MAAAYLVLASGDAAGAVADVAAGFHSEHPLSEPELEVLWDLVLARLALSAVHAAVQSGHRPDDPYLAVDEEPAWRALELLVPACPRLPLYRVRAACGFAPHPDSAAVRAHLAAQRPAPLLGTPWSQLRTVSLDLSVGSDLIGSADVGAGPATLRPVDPARRRGRPGLGARRRLRRGTAALHDTRVRHRRRPVRRAPHGAPRHRRVDARRYRAPRAAARSRPPRPRERPAARLRPARRARACDRRAASRSSRCTGTSTRRRWCTCTRATPSPPAT